jgi:uncharacterized membrane protein
MSGKTFSDGQVLKFGWNKMKANFWFFFSIIIIVGLISYLPACINRFFLPSLPWVTLTVNLLFVILQLIVAIGVIKISLKFTKEEKPTFKDLFNNFSLFFNYLAGGILYFLIVLAGFILLIIPGIIWSIRYQFFPYFIIDKTSGPVEALKQSSKLTNGAKWDILGFNILIGLVTLAGGLCLVVGLFATYPVVWIASALVYRQLLQQTDLAEEQSL